MKNKTAFALGVGMAIGVMWSSYKENEYELKRYTGNININSNRVNNSSKDSLSKCY